MAQNKVPNRHRLPMLEFFETHGSAPQCEAVVRAFGGGRKASLARASRRAGTANSAVPLGCTSSAARAAINEAWSAARSSSPPSCRFPSGSRPCT